MRKDPRDQKSRSGPFSFWALDRGRSGASNCRSKWHLRLRNSVDFLGFSENFKSLSPLDLRRKFTHLPTRLVTVIPLNGRSLWRLTR